MYFPQLSKDSRVWVYQSNRSFSENEKMLLNESFKEFVSSWAAHGSKLVADAIVIEDFFVALAVNEKTAMASGCSIDSSVKFIKSVGQQLNIDFFNRLSLIIEKDAEMKVIPFSQLGDYSDWKIYNTLVNTVEQFNESFLIQVKDSELYKMF